MREQECDPARHAVADLLPAVLGSSARSFPISFSLGCRALV